MQETGKMPVPQKSETGKIPVPQNLETGKMPVPQNEKISDYRHHNIQPQSQG